MVKIETAKGTISISPEVFTNIAGDAATRCFGVKGMAGKAKESGIYQLLRRESMGKGVIVSFNEDNTMDILLEETGRVFAAVLEDAGVFKCTAQGRAQFMAFVEHVNKN